MPMPTARAVRAAVARLPKGKPFTGARFVALGSRGAVYRALSRLAAKGTILRVAHGVFVRPRISRFVGAAVPDLYQVLETIARSNGETFQVHGAEAARRFGLTTQVPTAPVFHTSASTRTVRVAGVPVRLVHTSNQRRLQFAGEPAGVALSALWYLGKDSVTPQTIAAIAAALGPEGFARLRSADMPAWMAAAFAAADREAVHG